MDEPHYGVVLPIAGNAKRVGLRLVLALRVDLRAGDVADAELSKGQREHASSAATCPTVGETSATGAYRDEADGGHPAPELPPAA